MKSPFHIDGPAVISFSGGRTSGYMLRRILDEGLQPDVHVLFCNTGKECEETLTFVMECQVSWNVKIHWLEYERRCLPNYRSPEIAALTARARGVSGRATLPPGDEPGYREVSYTTASRNGEPFRNFIEMSGLPNPAMRACTTELKIRVMKRWMLDHGYEAWSMVIGIRADEPRRVAKLSKSPPERWEHELPLAVAGTTVENVLAFWKTQSFDLGLVDDPELGTYKGNCDCCILKSTDKILRIAKEEPARLDWWIAAEEDTGSVFRRDRPGYAQLRVLGQQNTTTGAEDDLGDCICHD